MGIVKRIYMDFWDIFSAHLQKKGPVQERFRLFEEAQFSLYFDVCPLQDAFRYRARRMGLLVAQELLDSQGNLNQKNLKELLVFFEGHPFLLGPHRESDAWIYQHIKNCLQALATQPAIWSWVHKCSPPLCHKKADEYVRQTLWPEELPRTLQVVHIRKAVLAAWLTLLRQTTGSCFATAPAILIQKQDPIRFFKDLYDILSIGQMKRVFAGKQYAVPLPPHLGKADLLKPLNSFGSIQQLAFSPGLWVALEAAGILKNPDPIEQKIQLLQSFLSSLDSLEKAQNCEELLRQILQKALDVTEKEIEEEAHLEQMQMTVLLARQSAVYYQRPSIRAQKVADWKKRLAKAYTAFHSLTECALLRVWEYTMASFCDVKVDFARWNLYIGLGLHTDQKGGIGAFLYSYLDRELQKVHLEATQLHQEYEQQLRAAQAAQSLLQGAFSEERRNQLKAQWMGQAHAAQVLLNLRDQAIAKADSLSPFLTQLIRQYDEKLQLEFQEIFDPSLAGLENEISEDSPAGFRLLYKQGRSDPTQWTLIHTGEEYLQSLRDFFSRVEREIELPRSLDRPFLETLTTALVQFLQESSFLQGSQQRAKEQGRRSPWDYQSGGTMQTLLQAYFQREKPFTEAKVIPRSPEQLLQFLMQEKKGHKEPLLMHSPTHAFLFQPDWLPTESISRLETNREWVRQIVCDAPRQEIFVDRISEKLATQEKALFLHLFRKQPATSSKQQFRSHLLRALQGVRKGSEESLSALIDSWIYEEWPLLSQEEALRAVQIVLQEDKKRSPSLSLQMLGSSRTYWSFSQLQQQIKALVLQQMPTPFSSLDWDQTVSDRLRQNGWAYPYPLLFADTNWSGWCFGWMINFFTETLELCRCNRIATQVIPMHDWKPWLSEQNTQSWVLLSNPQEYRL